MNSVTYRILDVSSLCFNSRCVRSVRSRPFIVVTDALPLGTILGRTEVDNTSVTGLHRVRDSTSDNGVLILAGLFGRCGTSGDCAVGYMGMYRGTMVGPRFSAKLELCPLSVFG